MRLPTFGTVLVALLAVATVVHAQQPLTSGNESSSGTAIAVMGSARVVTSDFAEDLAGRIDQPVILRASDSKSESNSAEGFTPRDGTVGVLFGALIVGGGQFYAGRPGKALALMGITVGSFLIGAGSCLDEAYVSAYSDSSPDCGTAASLMVVGALGSWIYGMATAPGDVRAYNRKHEARVGVSPVMKRRDGRTGLGLAMRF